jgi:adenosylcobinamide-phosphate synthase
MFLFGISNYEGGLDPLILLLMALVIETYAGQLGTVSRLNFHPLNALESLTVWFDLKLNRENRNQTDRAIRGGLTSLVIICMSGAVGWGIAWLSQALPFAWIFETILILMLIKQSGVYKAVQNVSIALNDHGLEIARKNVAKLTSEAPEKMDGHSIARMAIKILATSLVTQVVAPVFWYVLFGFSGLAVYHAIAIMSKKLSHENERYRAFGFAASQLNNILLIIPAQLSGIFIVLASLFVPTANPVTCFTTMFRDARKFHSYNLGVAIAAFAGAFKLALAGPKKFTQETKKELWLGNGTAQATYLDIRRSLYLFAVSCLLNVMWVAALTMLRYM